MTLLPSRAQLVAAVVLSALVGLIGGASAAWAIYQSRGPAREIVTANQPSGSSTGATVGEIAARHAASVVEVVTRPLTAGDLRQGTAGFACGFVVSSDGLVVTSTHALEGATALRVAFANGHVADATLAGRDMVHGVAVLRTVNPGQVTPLAFASQAARPGDPAVAVSAPPLTPVRVVAGTVSAAGQTLTVDDLGGPSRMLDAISVAAGADSEDDGAPLLDAGGAVIGVVVSVPVLAGPSGMVAAAGADAHALADRAGRGDRTGGPTLGVQSVVLPPATAGVVGRQPGALLQVVDPGGPADLAGLAPGDIVLSVVTAGGVVSIDGDHPLDATALGLVAGQPVTMTVEKLLAGGHPETRTVTVTPAVAT